MRLPQSFEITLARADFVRLLPAAVGNDQFVDEGAVFRHEEKHRSWRIDFKSLPEIMMGQMRMERHRLSFFFDGYSDTEIDQFMSRFEVNFRRGGG
ncbi:MAG: hypothetical protein WC100_19190 [Sterolibacterium sp.]